MHRRERAAEAAARINGYSGTGHGLTCPFDRTRLTAVYSTDLGVRVRCTHGMLRGGTYHEFSLPVHMTADALGVPA